MEPIIHIAGIATALHALDTWRSEFEGRRKIELATQIIEEAFLAKERIKNLRDLAEIADMETADVYSSDFLKKFNANYNKKELESLNLKAISHFGEDKIIFDGIYRCYEEIKRSVNMRYLNENLNVERDLFEYKEDVESAYNEIQFSCREIIDRYTTPILARTYKGIMKILKRKKCASLRRKQSAETPEMVD